MGSPDPAQGSRNRLDVRRVRVMNRLFDVFVPFRSRLLLTLLSQLFILSPSLRMLQAGNIFRSSVKYTILGYRGVMRLLNAMLKAWVFALKVAQFLGVPSLVFIETPAASVQGIPSLPENKAQGKS